MSLKEKYSLDYIKNNGLILFHVISGSHAHGTNIETSDKDFRGCFIVEQEDLYGLEQIDQVSDEKGDVCFYEVGRFVELLSVSNPNILELVFSPEDCIVYKHPVFDILLNEREKAISKICRESFAGYARSQIRKARGQEKMMNWEGKRVERKDPIDFCYKISGYKTIPLKKFLEESGMEQKFCGITNLAHMRDMYALFYDWDSHRCFSESISVEERDAYKSSPDKKFLGYKGLEKEGEEQRGKSNALRLSSIPKGQEPICSFYYNESGYSKHCKDYYSYQTWLKNRNMNRWVEVESHGQKIDGKNMLHCMRLIDMSIEIAQGNGVNVRRPNREELLNIRRGKLDLESILQQAEEKIKIMDELFTISDIPESVDFELFNKLLINIRKEFYVI